jgi:leucyl/phenylalanyl-tRNA--protein transferase
MGIYPMAPEAESEEVYWFEPRMRGIIPMDAFRVSKNVLKFMRKHNFHVAYNRDFEAVIRGCGDRESTWISEQIVQSYCNLHEMGFAHSVEVYDGAGSELLGGLYGVTMGAAFFGESMFQRKAEIHKVALYYCHQRLQQGGFRLWDTQNYTAHLGQFGCIEISQEAYLDLLKNALKLNAQFDPHA